MIKQIEKAADEARLATLISATAADHELNTVPIKEVSVYEDGR